MLNLPNISERFSGGAGIKLSSGNAGGVGGNNISGDSYSAHSGNSKNLFRRRLENQMKSSTSLCLMTSKRAPEQL